MRRTRFRLTPLLAALVAAGCDYSAAAPGPYPGPDVPAGLWTVSGDPAGIIQLAPGQLTEGLQSPTTLLTTPSALLQTVAGVAFAPDGTIWITSADDNLLLGFAPSALATSGSKPATTVVVGTAGSLITPTGLAFDPFHRLWVANHDGGTIVRFDPAQLAAAGSPTPAVVITVTGHPTSLAFDAAGSLWVSDNESQQLVRYSAAQLAASGAPAPATVIDEVNRSLMGPVGLAFDAAGKLWVANLNRNTIVAYGADQLAAGGSPVPRILISSIGGSFILPAGLAFDDDGNLWVVGAQGTLTEFVKADLVASGAPARRARVTVTEHQLFWSAAFWPVPHVLSRTVVAGGP